MHTLAGAWDPTDKVEFVGGGTRIVGAGSDADVVEGIGS